jgi:predicted kinase
MSGSITILCGISGSGKSTWVKEKCRHYVVLCPDEFRRVLTGHDFYGPAEESVWACVKTTARVLAGVQKRAILIDATAVTVSQRSQWVRMANELKVPIHCIILDVPLSICKERNLARQRQVPDEVIERQAAQLEIPTESEGFSSVVKALDLW